MKRPAFQFYPADWRKDMALQSCSVAARGLWMDCLCIAHECEPYGHLTVNGKAMTSAQIGRHTGLTAREAETLLGELEDAGVLSRNADGVIFSRRMVRDEDLRSRRAAGGPAGAEHGAKGAEAGSKGGRPKHDKGGSETPLTDESKPPPSSSSSSSASANTPTLAGGPPLSGKPASKAKPTKTPIPPDFGPSDAVRRWAAGKGYGQLDQHAEAFRAKVAANGYRYADWDAAFREAIREDWAKLRGRAPFGAAPPAEPDTSHNPGVERTQRLLADQAEAAAKATPPPAAILALRSRKEAMQ